MYHEHWLPYGTEVAPTVLIGRVVETGSNWQLVEANHGGRAFLVAPTLAARWLATGLVSTDHLVEFRSGSLELRVLDGGKAERLCRVRDDKRGPDNFASAVRFAKALGATRQAGETHALDASVYSERLTRILPRYEGSARRDDAALLGRWLSGGLPLSATSKGLAVHLAWLREDELARILTEAGLAPGRGATRTFVQPRLPDAGPFRLPVVTRWSTSSTSTSLTWSTTGPCTRRSASRTRRASCWRVHPARQDLRRRTAR